MDKPVVDKPVVDNEGSEKVEKMMEIDVSKAFRGFLGAKLIAGGPRTFWTKGKHQKPKKKIQNQGFWGLGGLGGSDPLLVPLKGPPHSYPGIRGLYVYPFGVPSLRPGSSILFISDG